MLAAEPETQGLREARMYGVEARRGSGGWSPLPESRPPPASNDPPVKTLLMYSCAGSSTSRVPPSTSTSVQSACTSTSCSPFPHRHGQPLRLLPIISSHHRSPFPVLVASP